MTVPGIVQSTLDGDDIAARVPLGGDDELFITPSSSLIYRAEGLLSDESVEEFPHAADRFTLSKGRRKTRFTLEYSLEGEREFAVPASVTEDVLHPVLAGVLNGNGITDPGETVVKTYQFSELTLILTSDRLVKHIGEAVWDGDFEQYHYDDVTSLSFEDGSVATQIVMIVDGRPQRIKAPNAQADDVCERLKRALFAYHDVNSLEELNARLGVEDDEEEDSRTDPAVAFGEGVDPLEANLSESDADVDTANDDVLADRSASNETDPVASAAGAGGTPTGADARTGSDGAESSERLEESRADGFEGSGFESARATTDPELLERLERLEKEVTRQTELIESQQGTIEQLIAELRQGR